MAWWQKKLLRYGLRYGLQKTGFLEDEALDLDNLDITIGKKNVIELKDVGLNIKKITKLAQLPPCLRIDTARILVLRLTIPADFYQSSIVAEIDRVDLSAYLKDDEAVSHKSSREPRSASPATTRTPQHRKTNRRIHSPPPYDPGGMSDSGDEVHMPTTEEIAQSFLREEPAQERRQLEASVAANTQPLEASFASESSDGEIGTGIGIGLPGFLSSFLQGLVDRFQLYIRDVQVRLEGDVFRDTSEAAPITLRLRIGAAELDPLDDGGGTERSSTSSQRSVTLKDITLDLLSDEVVLAELHELPSRSSIAGSGSRPPSSKTSDLDSVVSHSRKDSTSTNQSLSRAGAQSDFQVETTAHLDTVHSPRLLPLPQPPPSPARSGNSMMEQSHATVDADRFADAYGDNDDSSLSNSADLDIQAGDDNISWGSRRSHSNAPMVDLWKSMVSEDDLPDSLIIQPGRASTPRAQSSRGSSPLAMRQRRSVSPYERTVHSPGTWPRAEDSPERQHTKPSPGSWPMPEQSHQSAYEPFTQVLTAVPENVTDNMRSALETHNEECVGVSMEHEPRDVEDDGLAESRIFNHDEAQSMYMSAMTDNTSRSIPGGWSSDVHSDRSVSPEATPLPLTDDHVEDQFYEAPTDNQSGNVTPRPQSPEVSTKPQVQLVRAERARSARELLHVKFISVTVPCKSAGVKHDGDQNSSSHHSAGMPGTFSAYSEMSSSRRYGNASTYTDTSTMSWTQNDDRSDVSSRSIQVSVGSICGQLDMSTGRVLQAFVARLTSLSSHKEGSSPAIETRHVNFSIELESFSLALMDQIPIGITTKDSRLAQDTLISILGEHVRFQSATDTSLQFGGLEVLIGRQSLLQLQRGPDASSSADQNAETPALTVNAAHRLTASKRAVMEISLQTAPVQITLDMMALENTFGAFGGLSGILELGSTILTESGTASPVASKTTKGVRFAGETDDASLNPELKINGRVGGVTAILRTSSCAAMLRTSTLKAVYREHGAIATIEHIQLSAPHSGEDFVNADIAVDLTTLRIEYLTTPQDKDLERLLSLLTPSGDKYDSDDDILIDTLLRQRRKGSLLRAAVGNAKIRVDNWTCIPILSDFGAELSKLSAVTRYLPEDERPGLLTLLRIKEMEAQIPVSDTFGSIRLESQDLHLAQVGLPSLLAFSIGDMRASQVGGADLLHTLVQSDGANRLPVIMARMLGDEEEPTMKIKIYNMCLEYSVPIFVALSGLDETADAEEIVLTMTESIADLPAFKKPSPLQRSPGSDLPESTTNQTIINVLIHDSAIGLQPQYLLSKALLVLSDAHISTKAPPRDSSAAQLELRKASLLVIDRPLDTGLESPKDERHLMDFTNLSHRLTTTLRSRGYVQAASVMAARLNVHVNDSALAEYRRVEVDVTNDLLLLETCADSTQTLIAIMGALAPPSPPDKVPKYLTEPAMPIEDLVNSFSGEAIPVSKHVPELLYDVDEEPEEVAADIPMVGSIFEEPDDILAESALTGSLYGPTDALFGMDDDVENESTIGDDYPETAESLLEEDPFEMTNADDVRMSDAALMRDLARQCQVPIRDQPVDLGLYEIEDLGFDALSSHQQALGTQHRFNAPFVGKKAGSMKKKLQDLPFKLRIRDFNVIWHLYDGYDWQRTREGIMEAVEHVEQRAEARKARHRRSHNDQDDEESVIGDFLFNSIYIGVPNGHDAQELRRAINRNIDEEVSETASIPASGISRPTTAYSLSGQHRQRQRRRLKLGRSRNHKISFELKGTSADVILYPPGTGEVVSSVDLRLKDFEIFDKVPSSTWRKFLTHMTNDPSAREMAKPMFHIQLENVKTLESHSASEIRLHVTVLPLRLHVDQDALDFITRFFEFKSDSAMDQNAEGEKPFIQRIEVDTVDMCLDYKPKNIDYAGLRSGKTTEFMNFITLEAANIRLKHAIAYGVKSFEDLHPTLNGIWMPDIQRNQLPTILAGLAPVRSLVNIGSGVRDVIAIPVREYKKDGRLVRSIQKGAFHFGKTTTSELARLGAKVALGTQTLLSTAEDMLSPNDAARRISSDDVDDDDNDNDEDQKRAVSAYANPPRGLLPGLRSARRLLEHDLLTARDALIAVQGEFLDSRGPGEAAAAIGRHAPTVILRPVIGGMRAVGTTLLGVGNQIDREGMRNSEDKYKPR